MRSVAKNLALTVALIAIVTGFFYMVQLEFSNKGERAAKILSEVSTATNTPVKTE